MINEKTKTELDSLINGMNGAAQLEIDDINARCSEIKKQMDILAENVNQLADAVQQVSDGGVSDINSRCAEIMSRGMSYEELARYAAEGWSWATYMENAYDKTIQHQHHEDELRKLSDEMDLLVSRRDKLSSNFDNFIQVIRHEREVLEGKIQTHGVMKERAKAPRSTGGKKRDANTKYPEIREAVKAAWGKLANKKYGQRTEFAKKMLITYPAVTSLESFMRWTRAWDAENSKSDSTS